MTWLVKFWNLLALKFSQACLPEISNFLNTGYFVKLSRLFFDSCLFENNKK